MMGKLSQERDRLMKELKAINKRENEARATIEIPKAKKKYLGKCFKFRSGNGAEHWNLYTLVTEVNSQYTFVTFQFDDRPIIIGRSDESHIIGKEISRLEFDKAYKKAILTLEGMVGL